MKNILFFISIERNCFATQLEGIYAYSRDRNWHVQVIENVSSRRGIRGALSLWNPTGVIVEYSDQQRISPSLFADVPARRNGRHEMRNEDKFIWSLLLHIGYRMWGDDDSLKPMPDTLAFDCDVWEVVTERMAEIGMNMVVVDVGEGIVLPSHPELALKGSREPEWMRGEIERLKKMGIEAIPKLNFATCHDAWLGEVQHMVSTPEYYKTCADVIKDVAEMFGRPRLFHIGMDEESDMGIQERKDYIVKRQGSLFWHDVKFLEREVNKYGARAWMFADESWFNRESFYANCPKSILLSNWYYGRSFRTPEAKWQPPRMQAYADLDAAGFDQVPCATNWYPAYLYEKKGIRGNDVNFPLTVAHCRGAVGPERLKGFMMTTWAKTVESSCDQILHAIDLVGQSMLI